MSIKSFKCWVLPLIWMGVCAGQAFPTFETAARAESTDGLLEGEIAISSGDQLVGRSHVPTIGQLVAAAENPRSIAVATGRLVGSDANHYAPAWSSTGREVSVLRCDLASGSRRIVLHRLPGTNDLPETELVGGGERSSFDDFARWSSGSSSRLIYINQTLAGSGISEGPLSEAGKLRILARRPRGADQVLLSVTHRLEHPWLVVKDRQNVGLFRRGDELRLSLSKRMDWSFARSESLGNALEGSLSTDGTVIAMIRRGAQANAYSLVLKLVRNGREKVIATPAGHVLRSPRLSPNSRFVAFLHRPLQAVVWQLSVSPVAGAAASLLVERDVLVSDDFRHVGPNWSPSSSGLWFFTSSSNQQSHRLSFYDLPGRQKLQFDISKRITTPGTPVSNPSKDIPMVAFAAHDGLPRHLFATVFNRMP